jgi:hypothetical protein
MGSAVISLDSIVDAVIDSSLNGQGVGHVSWLRVVPVPGASRQSRPLHPNRQLVIRVDCLPGRHFKGEFVKSTRIRHTSVHVQHRIAVRPQHDAAALHREHLERLLGELTTLLADPERLQSMSEQACTLAHANGLDRSAAIGAAARRLPRRVACSETHPLPTHSCPRARSRRISTNRLANVRFGDFARIENRRSRGLGRNLHASTG